MALYYSAEIETTDATSPDTNSKKYQGIMPPLVSLQILYTDNELTVEKIDNLNYTIEYQLLDFDTNNVLYRTSMTVTNSGIFPVAGSTEDIPTMDATYIPERAAAEQILWGKRYIIRFIITDITNGSIYYVDESYPSGKQTITVGESPYFTQLPTNVFWDGEGNIPFYTTYMCHDFEDLKVINFYQSINDTVTGVNYLNSVNSNPSGWLPNTTFEFEINTSQRPPVYNNLMQSITQIDMLYTSVPNLNIYVRYRQEMNFTIFGSRFVGEPFIVNSSWGKIGIYENLVKIFPNTQLFIDFDFNFTNGYLEEDTYRNDYKYIDLKIFDVRTNSQQYNEKVQIVWSKSSQEQFWKPRISLLQNAHDIFPVVHFGQDYYYEAKLIDAFTDEEIEIINSENSTNKFYFSVFSDGIVDLGIEDGEILESNSYTFNMSYNNLIDGDIQLFNLQYGLYDSENTELLREVVYDVNGNQGASPKPLINFSFTYNNFQFSKSYYIIVYIRFGYYFEVNGVQSAISLPAYEEPNQTYIEHRADFVVAADLKAKRQEDIHIQDQQLWRNYFNLYNAGDYGSAYNLLLNAALSNKKSVKEVFNNLTEDLITLQNIGYIDWKYDAIKVAETPPDLEYGQIYFHLDMEVD